MDKARPTAWRRSIDQEDFHFGGLPGSDAADSCKLGSMKKLLMMMPGAAQMRQQLEALTSVRLTAWRRLSAP